VSVIIIDGVLFQDQPQEKIETDNIIKEKFQARLNQHIASKTDSYHFSQADISRGTFTSRTSKYTNEEIEMTKWIVQQEVMGGSLEHKTIVAQVLVNRLNSGHWGSSLKDVVLAKGQFPSKVNWFNKSNQPDEDTINAVELVLMGNGCKDCSQGALFFYNPKRVKDKATIRWFESMEFLFEIDGHRFFK